MGLPQKDIGPYHINFFEVSILKGRDTFVSQIKPRFHGNKAFHDRLPSVPGGFEQNSIQRSGAG
jgi:hypothetical protein